MESRDQFAENMLGRMALFIHGDAEDARIEFVLLSKVPEN
jgi:hypothetical protein